MSIFSGTCKTKKWYVSIKYLAPDGQSEIELVGYTKGTNLPDAEANFMLANLGPGFDCAKIVKVYIAEANV